MAHADANQGWYVGAGVGDYNARLDVLDYEYRNTAFQIFGGWRVSQYLALEGSYINLGTPQYDGLGSNNTIQGVAPWVVGTLPLGPLELFGRVGEYFYHYDTLSGLTHESFAYGGGVGTVIANRVEVRAEVDKLNAAGNYDAYAWWVTAAYRF
jgi:hypothetical protein